MSSSATPETAPVTPALRWALAGLSLSMLMPSLDTSIANVGLPALAAAFSASFPAVQWVVLAYLLAITTLVVSVGRLGDLVGRRRLLLAGIALFTLASLACGLAPNLGLLIAARAVQGLGAATMMVLTLALVGETVPKAAVGRAMGLLGTMSALGTTLGPSLGGLILAGWGWRMIFLVNLPLGLLNLALAWRTLPRDGRVAERAPFDVTGTLLIAGTLVAYGLAMTSGEGRFGPLNVALLLAAVAGAALFAWSQARSRAPLVRLSMFRLPALRAGLALGAVVSTVMMATLVVGPFYLARGLGLDPASVGLVMSAGPMMAALAGVPAGRLVGRFGTGSTAAAGLAAMAGGLLALCLAAPAFGAAGYAGAIVVVTAGYGLVQAANNTATMDLASGQRGVVSGLLSLSRNLGLITGASAMGAVFALASGTPDLATASPHAVESGMRATFVVAAVLVLVALALRRHKTIHSPARLAEPADVR